MNELKNHKALWTRKEEQDLIFELNNDNTLKIIAEKHNRSENAIKLRLASMIQKEVDKGTVKKKILTAFNITDEMMSNLLEFKRRFEDSKTTSSSPATSGSAVATSLILEKLNEIDTKLCTHEKYLKSLYKKIQNK